MHVKKHQDRTQHQNFVGDGIHESAHVAFDFELSSDVAVRPVSNRREHEDDCRCPTGSHPPREGNADDDWRRCHS
jgi:hypothetical protein